MGYGIVAGQQRGRTPNAERSGLDHRPDLMEMLPPRRFIGSYGRFARMVPMQNERAGDASEDEKRDTRPDDRFSGLQRGHGGRTGSEDEARKHRSRSFEQRIDQRRAKIRRRFLVRYFPLIGKLHFRAHVL